MFNPQHILVPVDFSPCSLAALDDAAALARTYGADIDVLHVWEMPMLVRGDEVSVSSGLSPSIVEAISGQAHQKLALFVGEARRRGIAIRNSETVAGDPYRTIVEAAERGHYDLIVIGTHGRKRFARVFLGSVAERVVRYASCPVLVARASIEPAAAATEAEPTHAS